MMDMEKCRSVCYKKEDDNKLVGVRGRRERQRRRRRLVRMKVEKLQRLVPGGHGLQLDPLCIQTADYILHLKLQVNVLEAILKFHQP